MSLKDIEEVVPPASVVKKRVPHGSSFVHDVLRKKKIQIAAQYLRGPQGKQQWVIALLIMIGVGIALSLVGSQLYSVGHPPLQLIGVCQSPAFLRNGNCETIVPQIITVSGVATATEVTVSAGTEYLTNGTLSYGGS